MTQIPETVRVVGKCPLCKKDWHIDVDTHNYAMWRNNMCLIQDAFPDMGPSDRELLISGICNDCWQTMFKPDDEDE
jgi:hypothetical protein